MFTKVYEKGCKVLKQNWKFLTTLLVIFVLFTFEFPYYIEAPGGLIDVSERITLEKKYPVHGSFNLAYVSEIRATLPMLVYSYFNDDYDILKKEEVLGHETQEEIDYRNHLMLEEANQNAIYVGFSRAKEYVAITNRKLYVAYIDEESQTNLKVGDQIIAVGKKSIHSKEEMNEALQEYTVGDTVSITVMRDKREIVTESTLYESDNRAIVGMVMGELKDLDTNIDVSFTFKASESGPSGGFMMALSIYNYLTEEDITYGKKIVGTGTIDTNGNVGSIGGIEYKIKAAIKNKADFFFVPADNYEQALQVKEDEHLEIELVMVKTIDDAIAYLENL